MKHLFTFFLITMAGLAAAATDELVPPAEAYQYSVEADAESLTLRWDVRPGYYLYRDKFAFASKTDGITLGVAQLPAGKRKTDEFFGEMEIYRGKFEVVIPLQRQASSSRTLQLEIKSQGCADIGICFPPQTWPTQVALPALATVSSSAATPDLVDLFGTSQERDLQGDILPPEQAFILSAELAAPGLLRARWVIAPGYYMYRNKFRFSSEQAAVTFGEAQFPAGRFKEDEYFGRSEVYFDQVEVLVPVVISDSSLPEFLLLTESQGCKDNGICYPPFTQLAPVATDGLASNAPLALPGSAATSSPRPQKISEQARLASLISDSHLAWVMLTFFGLGLLLAFTPCVLPMIPILSGIIAGQGDQVGTRRAFLLSLAYVMGMAVTYTAAGAIAAIFGQQFQAIFQQPWIIISFATLFVVLSLSMFGLFELQMPGFIQSRLATASNKQQAGTYVGTVIMGVLSALIVTACVAPPLVATLAVIGQAGEPVRGALALFAMSLGMGAPLLVVGASAGKLLPRAGAWMNAVKAAFGVMLLGVAIWMLERVLPHAVTMFMWASLLVTTGVYMGAPAALSGPEGGWQRLWRGLGLIMVVYGILIFVGVASGSRDTWRPLAGSTQSAGANQAVHGLAFQRVKTVADLERAVADASSRGQTVMLDFYADWCVSCLEMENYTFTDSGVQAALKNTVLLQADVTANDDEDKALLKHFKIYGPPTIAFYDRNGVELDGYRVVGYMPAEQFSAHVVQALAADSP